MVTDDSFNTESSPSHFIVRVVRDGLRSVSSVTRVAVTRAEAVVTECW